MGLIGQMLSSRRSSGSLPFQIDLISTDDERAARMENPERVKKFNADVRSWAKEASRSLKSSVSTMIDNDEELSKSINAKVSTAKREVSRIGFAFAREGIYTHKGAGVGQGGFKGGSKWINAKGETKSTNPNSFMKMGTGNRKPKHWFDPVIEQKIPQLADMVADYDATMVLNETSILID